MPPEGKRDPAGCSRKPADEPQTRRGPGQGHLLRRGGQSLRSPEEFGVGGAGRGAGGLLPSREPSSGAVKATALQGTIAVGLRADWAAQVSARGKEPTPQGAGGLKGLGFFKVPAEKGSAPLLLPPPPCWWVARATPADPGPCRVGELGLWVGGWRGVAEVLPPQNSALTGCSCWRAGT